MCWTDRSFAEFFATELDVDIDDPIYAEHGGSKGKRLRCFLQKVDDATAVRTMQALWEHRVQLLVQTGQPDPVPNAEGRYLSLVAKLSGQAASGGKPPRPAFDLRLLAELREELVQIASLQPHERGYAFEAFLKRSFDMAGLTAREPFRNIGEQIDGSFLLGDETYLLEAKWHSQPTGVADLHVFHGKLEQKAAAWARGLFVSYNGFTTEGLAAFGAGNRLICMDGRDIRDAFEWQIPLKAVLERKVRRAAETGQPFITVKDLFRQQTAGDTDDSDRQRDEGRPPQ
jgi:hypothetical protein